MCGLQALLDSSLFRDEVLQHFVDGRSLVAVTCLSRAMRVVGEEVAEVLLLRHRWLWPSLARRAGGRPLGLGAPGAVDAFERKWALVLLGGTREESEPMGTAAILRRAVAVPNTAAVEPVALREGAQIMESCVPRNAAACAVTSRGDLVLAGGWDGYEPLRSCEVFDGSRQQWRPFPDMRSPRCFAAAVFLPWYAEDRLLVVGGGDTLWVGGAATTESELLVSGGKDGDDDGSQHGAWTAGPSLLAPRCGHGCAVVAPRDAVVAAGGYGGGDAYLASAERLGRDGRFSPLPPMTSPRTGVGLGAGPDGCVYAAGGSPDGSDALRSAERLDLRARAWEPLPDMINRRGYVAAAFDARGDFYVHGGYNEWGQIIPFVEVFDVRAHRWRPATVDLDEPEDIVRAQHALLWTTL